MTGVTRRARHRGDRAGDPLDGLVNLFDLGVVLAVAFLLAALASVGLSGALGAHQRRSGSPVVVPSDQVARTLPPGSTRTVGNGTPVGRVYRLRDGRLIYVLPSSVAVPAPAGSSPAR